MGEKNSNMKLVEKENKKFYEKKTTIIKNQGFLTQYLNLK